MLSPNGIYGVKLWTLGVPHTTIVDDYLPRKPNGKNRFANDGDDKSIWAAIIEKAFAKNFGNYYHLVELRFITIDAMRTLTGAPYETIYHAREDAYWQVNAYDADQLFNLFTKRFEDGAIVQTLLWRDWNSYGYNEHNYYGLHSGVYNVLGLI